jgi:ABC-type multidrug transport system fused ATPase/permease subunit
MNRRRLSICLICIALAAAALAGSVYQRSNPLVTQAAEYNQVVLKSTLGVYASLRVLNAVMSPLIDADLSAGIGVAGTSLSPGQLLDPVDDTVERMAALVFAMAIVSGVLAIFLPAAGSIGAVMLGLGLLVYAVQLGALGMNRVPPWPMRRAANGLVKFGLALALVLPAAYSAAFLIGDWATAESWGRAMAVLESMQGRYGDAAEVPAPENLQDRPSAPASSSNGVAAIPETASEEESGAFERLWSAVTGTLDATKQTVGEAVSATGDTASRVTRAMANPFAEEYALIRGLLEHADDLFFAFANIAIAYLLKLILLPLVLAIAGFLIIDRALRQDDGNAEIAQLRREVAELRERNRRLAEGYEPPG